jgi:phospholipid transport system substrate-binding protein
MEKYSVYIFVALLFVISSNGFAQESQEIKTMLESRDNEIKELLGPKGNEYTSEQRNSLKDIINGVIDFESMARFALDDTFNEISGENRDEFVSLFSTIIRDQSLNRLDIYRADVVYNEIEVIGDSAYVSTTAQLEDVRTPVHYKMEKMEGEWFITDMIIDDVSTAESYHRQFQSIIRQRGFDALLTSLRNRAARSST